MKQNNNNMIVALSLVCKYLSNENKNHTKMGLIIKGGMSTLFVNCEIYSHFPNIDLLTKS